MIIRNRNLFRITRFVFFKLPPVLRFLARFRKKQKRILLIKTDAIGDYVLFRNFIEVLKTSEKYQDYQLDLVASKLLTDFATTYERQYIDQFYFIRPDDYYEAPLKTLKFAWKLFRGNYAVALQPTFSRTLINDAIAAFTAAGEIIGFESDNERIDQRYKKKSDGFYTTRLLLPATHYFEFDRTKYFFEQILQQPLTIQGPYLHLPKNANGGIVIFPGAGVIKRGWGAERFLELIKKMLENTALPVTLAGGPAEAAIGNYLTENLPDGKIVNLINKTTLPQLAELITSARLVISNETSAIHIAAATATPCVCILGGGHYGRFAPYPAHVPNAPVCVYHAMDCFNCNWNCIYQSAANEPYPCIAKVELDNVWQAVLKVKAER